MESPDWEHIEKQARYMVNLLEHQTPSPILLRDTTTPELVSLDSPISKTPSEGFKETIQSSNSSKRRHQKPSQSIKFPLQPDSDDSGLLDIRHAQIPHLEDLNDDSPAVNQDLLEHSKKFDLETCGASSLNSTFSVEDDGVVQANMPEISPERSSDFSVDAVIENCKVKAVGISENGPLSASGPHEEGEVVMCEQQKLNATREQLVSDLNCDHPLEVLSINVDNSKSSSDVHSESREVSTIVSSTSAAATKTRITESEVTAFPTLVASTENNVNEADGIVFPTTIASAENNVNEADGIVFPTTIASAENDVNEADGIVFPTTIVSAENSVNEADGIVFPTTIASAENSVNEADGIVFPTTIASAENNVNEADGIIFPTTIAAENNVNGAVDVASEINGDKAGVSPESTPAIVTKTKVDGKASPAAAHTSEDSIDERQSKLKHAQCSNMESRSRKVISKRYSCDSTFDGQEIRENPCSTISKEISTVHKPALDKDGMDQSVAAAEPASKVNSKVPLVSKLPFRRSVSGLTRTAGSKGSTSKSMEPEPVIEDDVPSVPKKEKLNTRHSLSELKPPLKTTVTRKQSVSGLRKVQLFHQPAGLRNMNDGPVKSQLPLAPGKTGAKKPTVKNVSTDVKSRRTTRESLMPMNGSKLMALRKQVSILPKGPMKVTHPATQSQTVSKDLSRFPLKAIQPAHGSKALTKTATQTSVPADGSKTVTRPLSSNTTGKDAGTELVQGTDGSKTVTKVSSSAVNQAKIVGAGDTPMKTDVGLNPRNLADVFQHTPPKAGVSGKRKKTFLPTPTRGSSSSSVSSMSSMESPFFNRGSNCSEDEDPFKPKRFLVQNTPDLEPRRMSMWSPIQKREGIPDEEKAFQCTKRKAPRMALHQQ